MFWNTKKCPLCGMKEKEGKGVKEGGKWFCNEEHVKQYKNPSSKNIKHKCC